MATWYTDPTVPALAFVDPLLRDVPSPIAAWVVLRGLLDALGVALLYLAARPLMGVWFGTLAAVMYATSLVTWGFARAPSAPFWGIVTSATLFATVCALARPTPLRGAILGIVLGVLARSLPFGVLAIVVGAVVVALGCASRKAGRVLWQVGAMVALGLVLVAGPVLYHGLTRPPFQGTPFVWGSGGEAIMLAFGFVAFAVFAVARSMWFWANLVWLRRAAALGALLVIAQSASSLVQYLVLTEQMAAGDRVTSTLRGQMILADTVREAARRVGSDDVTIVDSQRELNDWITAPTLDALLHGHPRVVRSSDWMALPTDREAVYLIPRGQPAYAALRQPSSSAPVVSAGGIQSDARVVTLRPRTPADWLASARVVPNGAFADGSAVVGVTMDDTRSSPPTALLYWQFASEAGPRSVGERVEVQGAGTSAVARPAPGPAPDAAPTATSTPSSNLVVALPPAASRQPGGLVVQRLNLAGWNRAQAGGVLRIRLVERDGGTIRTADGRDILELTLGGTPR